MMESVLLAGVAVLAAIAEALAVLTLAFFRSPDLQDYIDEYQGAGSIADNWALEVLDRAAEQAAGRSR
jgi:hypothetical protein